MKKKFRPDPTWGSSRGIIEVNSGWRHFVPATLVAEVQQVVHRYSWGTDERNLAVLKDCFTEDGVWEADVMGETRVGPFTGHEQVMDWFTRFWPVQRDQRRHVFTNLIVERVEGDTVLAFALMQVYGATRAVSTFETSSFCRIELRRHADGLRISRFTAGFDSPFWAPHEVDSMEPWLLDLFGIDHRDRPGTSPEDH